MVSLVRSNVADESNLPEVNLPKVNLPQGGEDLPPETGKPLQITITKGTAPAEQPPAEAAAPMTAQKEAPAASQAEPAPSPQDAPTDMQRMIQEALHNGYTSGELKNYLVQSKGMSEDDADLAVVDSVKQKVKQAKAVGYSDSDVLNYLVDNGYDGKLADSAIKASNADDNYKKLDYKPDLTEEEKAMDIADLYKNVYQKYSTLGKQAVGLFDEQTGIEARREINQLNYAVSQKLRKEGIDSFIDPESGEVMMKDKQGNISQVDSSFMNSIWNSKGEFAGAVAGGIAGARTGAMAGAAAGAVFPPAEAISVPVGTVVGGLIGSATGAMAGRGADLAINSMKLSEDLTAKLYLSQMKQAGAMDVVVGVVGGTVLKAGSKGAKGIVKGWKYVTHGNPNGAYKALKENLNLSDDQAKDIVANWEKLNQTAAPGKGLAEKALAVIPQTAQGAESAVKQAASVHERVATMAKQSIDARAKSIHAAVDSVTDENVGNLVRNDLKGYQDDVKGFYDTVKKQAAGEIDGTDFRFNLEKLAIEPVMKNIEKRLSNPAARERFVNYASRIESASADRTFSGLLELRAAVNDFKYSKTLSVMDKEALNTVLNKIDGQINKAVKEYMPQNGKQWTANFAKAKDAYSSMKKLQDNALFKLVNKPGATEHSIQQALSRYGSDKDVDAEVFNQLVERLSPTVRSKVEGAAVKNLVNKNTIGGAAEYQAVNIPQLAEDLKSLNLQSQTGKNLTKVAEELAKVYKNDAVLHNMYGRTLAETQSTPAKVVASKAQRSFIGAVWNGIYKYAPTQGARNQALIMQVGKFMKNPLHQRTAEDLLKAMPKEVQPEMKSLMKELQIEAAKNGTQQVQKDFVNMYKQSKSGKLVVTEGALGKGVYLVDKIKNPTPEMNVIKHEVNMSRMATLDTISSIVGRPVELKEVRTLPGLRDKLVEQGYLGIKVDDKAMLFPENTLGVNLPKTVGPKEGKKNIIKDESGSVPMPDITVNDAALQGIKIKEKRK